MTFTSHGAVRSFSRVTVRLPELMRSCPYSRGLDVVQHPNSLCLRRRFASSCASQKQIHRRYARMNARKTAHQAWHVSRGIVFESGSSVVYPRLPQVRHHSAPAAVVAEERAVLPPVLSLTGDAAAKAPAGQGIERAPGSVTAPVVTPQTAVITAVSTSTTAAVADDNAAKEGQAPSEGAAKTKPKDAAPAVNPFTPLDFKIPDKAFQDAAKASGGTPQSFWNFTLYRGPVNDGKPDTKVKVHYCTSSRTTEKVIKEYFAKETVLGLDLEWMPNALKSFGPRSNVSLIQLASPSRIGLFHIAAYPAKDTLVAPSLKKILEDPDVTKVGVWIKGDCTRLSEYLAIKTRGQFELSHLYKLVKYSKSGEYGLINKKLAALATQVKEVLGLPIFKGNDVRASDWSKCLNMDQIIYSSSDAYAAVQLYAVLDHQRKALDPVPPLPHHAELNLPIPVTKPVPPETTEEQDADPDAAVEEKAGSEGKLAPEDESALKETLVCEDGPVPDDQQNPEGKAVLADNSSPGNPKTLSKSTNPVTPPVVVNKLSSKASVKPPLPQCKSSPAAESQPQPD
ncbi:ribonuclease H-like protein [Parathielavia hyrcaniae]|uniref:Ribonuclease H-like protein n=1 Tax=Parathielavia hyrcaniae TaxID=113614 RepID=A0AAN6Q9V3_9PEZI|nr:ribonuclease H-like protein [Parathielavia hyrcaniae]